MTWALGVTDKANQITGLGISTFTTIFSPEVGTLVWSTFVPDLASLEAATDKLAVDDAYISMVDEGARFIQSNIDDAVLQIVHGDVDPSRQVEYATTVQAVCATGNVARGMELGVEIAQRVTKITGLPSLFGSGTTGPYGSVAWLTGYADVQELERATGALGADTSFGKFIDDNAPGVYVEDFAITQTLIYRRLG